MKTDKISFGTTPLIGNIAARNGLPKYKKGLADGIFDAFQKLATNNINDKLYIRLGIKKGAKKVSTDALEISYYPNRTQKSTKSSFAFSPKTLEKFSKKRISNLILETYEKLKISNKETDAVSDYPCPSSKKISNIHSKKINELLDAFGIDDW